MDFGIKCTTESKWVIGSIFTRGSSVVGGSSWTRAPLPRRYQYAMGL